MDIIYQNGIWMVDDGRGKTVPLSEVDPTLAQLLVPYTDQTLTQDIFDQLQAQAHPVQGPALLSQGVGGPAPQKTGQGPEIVQDPSTGKWFQKIPGKPARPANPAMGDVGDTGTPDTWKEVSGPQGQGQVITLEGRQFIQQPDGTLKELEPQAAATPQATIETDPKTGQQYIRQPNGFITMLPADSPPTVNQEWLRLYNSGDQAGADALFDSWNRMTPNQKVIARQNDQQIQMQALRLGLDIAQSPGDYLAYIQLTRGPNEPPIGTPGERAVPLSTPIQDALGGGLGQRQEQTPAPGQGAAQKPAFGPDSQAMDEYQRGLDRQREQRGADGLTLEERIRRNNPPPPRTLSGTGDVPPALSIGEQQRQAPGGVELDAIDRQIQALVAAGDTAETPEDIASAEARIAELQTQRQQIFQGQRSGGVSLATTATPPLGSTNTALATPVADRGVPRSMTADVRYGRDDRGTPQLRTMDFQYGRDDIDPATGRPYTPGYAGIPGARDLLQRPPGSIDPYGNVTSGTARLAGLGQRQGIQGVMGQTPRAPAQGGGVNLGQALAPILNPTREPRSLANITGVGFQSQQQQNMLTPTERKLRSGLIGLSGVPQEDYDYQEKLNSGLYSPTAGGGLAPVTQSLSRIRPRARAARGY